VVKALPYGIGALFSVMATTWFAPRPAPFSGGQLVFSFVPQVLTIAFYMWLVRFARRSLPGDVAAPPPLQFVFRRALSSRAREAVLAARAARHWTPS
jgi:hypothetical protein